MVLPGATPIASTVEQSRDQHFDFTRDAVCHERVADRTALAGEIGALWQGYGGGDAFGGGSRRRKVSVQFDAAVEFRDRQLPDQVVEMPGAALPLWLRVFAESACRLTVEYCGQVAALGEASRWRPVCSVFHNRVSVMQHDGSRLDSRRSVNNACRRCRSLR